MGDQRHPELGLGNLSQELPDLRRTGQELSQEAHGLLNDARREVRQMPDTAADRLLTQYGILPPTRITSEDSPTNISVQYNLRERTAQVAGSSERGMFTLDIMQRQPAAHAWSPLHLHQLSYDLSAQSADERTRLHLWAPDAGRAPYIDFRTVGQGVGFSYQRDETQNRASLLAQFPNLNLAASHDFRRNQFSLTGRRPLGTALDLGVNVDFGPHHYYNFGAQLRYEYGGPPAHR